LLTTTLRGFNRAAPSNLWEIEMSYHREMFLKEQAEIEAATAKRHIDNLKHMEELAKIRPVPSPDEIRKATGLPPRDADEPTAEVVEEVKPAEPVVEAEAKPVEEDKVEKTSTAEQPSGGQYKTRDARAKR
jgi:hypothetical protein